LSQIRLQNVLGRDSSARPMLPIGELAADRERLNLARAFVTVLAACPRYSSRKAQEFGSKDIIRMLFTSIRCARAVCRPITVSEMCCSKAGRQRLFSTLSAL
jgi:hypothetical protein